MSDDRDHRTESTSQAFSEDPHESAQSSPATEIDERTTAEVPVAVSPPTYRGEPVQLDDMDESDDLDELDRRPESPDPRFQIAPDADSKQLAGPTPAHVPQAGARPADAPPPDAPPTEAQARDDDTAVLPVTSAHPAAAQPGSNPTPSYSTPSYSTPSDPTTSYSTPSYPTSSYPAPSSAAGGYPGPASATPAGGWPPADSPTQAIWPVPVTPPAPAFAPAAAPLFPDSAALGEQAAKDADGSRAHREVGAGWGGALGLVGLSAAVGGMFALPIVHYAGGHGNDVFFGQLRHLASFAVPAGGDSTSPVGGQLATIWWRYAALGSLGGAALAVLIIVTFPRVRRVFGALLFLLGVAMTAMLVLVGAQTNDPQTVTFSLRYDNVRLGLNHLGLGFWVAVGGCAVLAIAGLSALMRQRR